MKVLELFSGIGGMHLALKESGIEFEVIAAVDINTNANEVYKHNFPHITLMNRNVQSLTVDYINKLGVDTILMSPPCQPFTRNGLQADIADTRTCSFTHLLKLLPELYSIKKILIENVKGFETSQMRNILIEVLEKSDYVYQEFILTPKQFGIPNTRHRYYCIAKKLPLEFNFQKNTLMDKLPSYCINAILFTIENILDKNENLEDFRIPDKILQKRAYLLDICTSDSKNSCCFTKAYGRYIEGTGSVYTQKNKLEVDAVYKQLKNYDSSSDEFLNCIRKLQLRFFTPKEVCRLMSFPETFSFPTNLSNKQKYMLLGNSINVKVVAELIKLL